MNKVFKSTQIAVYTYICIQIQYFTTLLFYLRKDLCVYANDKKLGYRYQQVLRQVKFSEWIVYKIIADCAWSSVLCFNLQQVCINKFKITDRCIVFGYKIFSPKSPRLHTMKIWKESYNIYTYSHYRTPRNTKYIYHLNECRRKTFLRV